MLTLTATMEDMKNASTATLQKTIKLAIGRLFRLGSRKAKAGDIEQYEQCKWIIMTASEIISTRNAN